MNKLDVTKIDAKSFLEKAKRFEREQFNIVRTDPWVPITLRENGVDKTFKLELSYGAVKAIYRDTGLNISVPGEVDREHLGNMEFLAKLLLYGLATHQLDMTQERVESMIAMKHRMYYIHVLSQAMEATQPDLEYMQELVGMVKEATKDEEGEAEAELPLVEIEQSPISGEPVVN